MRGNNIFDLISLINIIKIQKKYICYFTLLFTLLSVLYHYYIIVEYNKNNFYIGIQTINLGVINFVNNDNIKTIAFVPRENLKKSIEKNNDLKVSFKHRKVYDKIIINSISDNKDTIINNIQKAVLIAKQNEIKFYAQLLDKLKFKNQNVSMTYIYEVDKISINKQELNLNIYYILSSFLISLISSILLSVLLNKLENNKINIKIL
jgi:hypothetical protein